MRLDVVPPYRDPVLLARMIATMDQLSGGRIDYADIPPTFTDFDKSAIALWKAADSSRWG